MPRVLPKHAGALLFLACLGSPLTGAETEVATRIDAYVAPFVAAGHLSGSILVASGDAVVYERSFGLANRELEVPVGPATRFNVASLTKPMTQIVALRLFEEGALAADQPLARWIPDFPQADRITVGMLLRHEAGIAHRVTTAAEEALPQSAADLVELAKGHELLFEPGSKSAYSTAGYSVLARVLELAGKASYAELLAKYVFEPVGMDSSLHPEGGVLIPNRAGSYRFVGNGGLVNSPLKDYSYLVGGGSVFSTPRDLLRLMRGVQGGAFGETARANLVDEEGIDWNGRTDGYRSFADYHAASGVYVAFVGNTLTGAHDLLRRDLPLLAAGEAVEIPVVPRHQAVAVAPEVLAGYVGDYELRPGSVLSLAVEDGEVAISGWLLLPTSESTFFSPQDYAEITVVTGADGRVERLDWTVAGTTHKMPRVSAVGD